MRRVVAAVVVVVLLAGAGGVLGARAYQDMLLLRRPATVRVQDTSRIRGWMTVRFVAQAHRVSVGDLAAQLGAPADGDITLDELARTRGVPPQQEVAAARDAVAQLGGTPEAPGPGGTQAPPGGAENPTAAGEAHAQVGGANGRFVAGEAHAQVGGARGDA